jgi:hypothetical protein
MDADKNYKTARMYTDNLVDMLRQAIDRRKKEGRRVDMMCVPYELYRFVCAKEDRKGEEFGKELTNIFECHVVVADTDTLKDYTVIHFFSMKQGKYVDEGGVQFLPYDPTARKH